MIGAAWSPVRAERVMTPSALPAAAPSVNLDERTQRSADVRLPYWQRVAKLTRERWQSMAAFVLLMLSVEVSRAWSLREDDFGNLLPFVFGELWFTGWLALGAVAGPVLGAASSRRGVGGAVLTGVLTIGTVATGVGLLFVVNDGPVSPAVRDGLVHSNAAFALRSLWTFSLAGLLFAAYCSARERHMAVTQAFRAAERERVATERDVIESRLKVLQARIEPEFLFGTLERVQARYRDDPAGAEHVLDRLIVYLRAALPHLRGEATRLEREFELVRAYLDVLDVASIGTIDVSIVHPPEFDGTRLPPMVLLPLVQAAVAGDTRRRRRLAIDVSGQGRAQRITITVEGGECPSGWGQAALSGPREALRNLLGKDAKIALATGSEFHQLRIDLPSGGSGSRPDAPLSS
jgi:hypothetical protein